LIMSKILGIGTQLFLLQYGLSGSLQLE